MPSITDSPSWEFRSPEVAFKLFEENLGQIHDQKGDGNSLYYVIFEAFQFLGKDQACKKLFTYKQNYPIVRIKRMELIRFGKTKVDHFVCHPDAFVSIKLVQLLPERHSHLFGLNAPNLNTKHDRNDAFMETTGNSVYTEEFDNTANISNSNESQSN